MDEKTITNIETFSPQLLRSRCFSKAIAFGIIVGIPLPIIFIYRFYRLYGPMIQGVAITWVISTIGALLFLRFIHKCPKCGKHWVWQKAQEEVLYSYTSNKDKTYYSACVQTYKCIQCRYKKLLRKSRRTIDE